MRISKPTFSIVIPVHNETDSIDELVNAIEKAVQPLTTNHEVIFIDDASTDDTLATLRRLARTHRQIRVFSFRRHLGKSPALACGFRMAAGEYILTMDADLQDDPADLQQMYDHLIREHCDMVSGWRRERRDRALNRVLEESST